MSPGPDPAHSRSTTTDVERGGRRCRGSSPGQPAMRRHAPSLCPSEAGHRPRGPHDGPPRVWPGLLRNPGPAEAGGQEKAKREGAQGPIAGQTRPAAAAGSASCASGSRSRAPSRRVRGRPSVDHVRPNREGLRLGDRCRRCNGFGHARLRRHTLGPGSPRTGSRRRPGTSTTRGNGVRDSYPGPGTRHPTGATLKEYQAYVLARPRRDMTGEGSNVLGSRAIVAHPRRERRAVATLAPR